MPCQIKLLADMHVGVCSVIQHGQATSRARPDLCMDMVAFVMIQNPLLGSLSVIGVSY